MGISGLHSELAELRRQLTEARLQLHAAAAREATLATQVGGTGRTGVWCVHGVRL